MPAPDPTGIPTPRSPETPDSLVSPAVLDELPDDRDTALLLHLLPEFVPVYVELVETFDDTPGGPVVFSELASFVAAQLTAVESQEPVLRRALDAVESVAARGTDASELIGYAFLDSLSPDERRMITQRLGPHTRSMLDELELGSG